MNVPDIIIAVDGYSSTGKSTFAKLAAAEFGFLYLDSGAMYRGVTLHAMESGFARADGSIDTASLIASLEGLDLHFEADGLHIAKRVIEPLIRSLEVSSLVSPVAAIPEVRTWVDKRLHLFSEGGRVIMDGRDIGTTVFPNAELKIFMTADPHVRARRRYDEMVAKGESPSLDEVYKNLLERDHIDSHRATSPLTQAPDAFVLDNTDMNLHEEIVWLRGLIQGRFHILG